MEEYWGCAEEVLALSPEAVLGNWGGGRKGDEFLWQRWYWKQMEQACIFPREEGSMETGNGGGRAVAASEKLVYAE